MTGSGNVISVEINAGEEKLAAAVGLIVDRTNGGAPPVGNCWMIEERMVATCAHLILPFRKALSALKVVFPHRKLEFGVESVMFHPDFDLARADELTGGEITRPHPDLALLQHNAAVLKLTEEQASLSDETTARVNEMLSQPAPPMEQGLGGNLGEIDLYVVLQTITTAQKGGIITICDDRNNPVAGIFCQNGRIVNAHYFNLHNEMALYQIVSRDLKGNFFFWAASQPNWKVTRAISRPADMVLIESYRRFDELKKTMPLVGPPDTLIKKRSEEPQLEVLPADVQDYARMLWSALDGGTPIGQLWQLADIDDLAVYSTVFHLLQTSQVERLEPPALEDADPAPLKMAVNAPLAPWDVVSSINRDGASGIALVRRGNLLGALREDDPWHLIHNIRLVIEAAGSPILKDGKVVGMHCGNLADDSDAGATSGSLQEMLWVDSIVECLKGAGEKALVRRLTVMDGDSPELPAAPKRRGRPAVGCREVARVDCPRCGRTSLESARFCRSCGQRLVREMETAAPPEKAELPELLVPALLIAACAGAGFFLFSPASPLLSGVDFIDDKDAYVVESPASAAASIEPTTAPSEAVAASPWVEVAIYQQVEDQKQGHPVWQRQPAAKSYRENDLIYLEITMERPGFVYLLYNGTSDPADIASLIYPAAEVDNAELEKDKSFTIPSDVSEKLADNATAHVGLRINPPAGIETLVVLASDAKLALIGKGKAKLVNQVYRISRELLEASPRSDSLEVSRSRLPEELFAGQPADSQTGSRKTSEASIYIGRRLIRHTE